MKQGTALLLLVPAILLNTYNSFSQSPRSVGMGNASASLADVWSIRNNQAGMAWLKTPVAGIVYENKFMLKELSTQALGFIYPLKHQVLGVSVSSFGYNLYRENNFKIGAAKSFGNNFSFGMGLNAFQTVIAEYGSKTTFVAEAGVHAKPIPNLTIGAHVFNLTGTTLAVYNKERIPSMLRIGADYSFSKKVLLIVEVEKSTDKKAMFKTGIEYHPVQALFLRCGISTHPITQSFGAGFISKQFKIDIAVNYHYLTGISTQAGIIYEFKRAEQKEKTP